MKDGFQIYDTHVHLGLARHSGREQTVDAMLRSMDSVGIDKSLLIPFPAVEDHVQAHNLIAAAIRQHPDRFSGAACVYPFIPEPRFRDEVRRCAEELGFVALKLHRCTRPSTRSRREATSSSTRRSNTGSR
jgi:hypothetical protein